MIVKADGDAARGVPFADLLKRSALRLVSGDGKSQATAGQVNSKFSLNSFGAHFIEINWQPEIVRLRVSGVVWGIGMALMEHTSYDSRNGRTDQQQLRRLLSSRELGRAAAGGSLPRLPGQGGQPLGARGIGEIGPAGVAAAITDAVHHATGIRMIQGRGLSPLSASEHSLGDWRLRVCSVHEASGRRGAPVLRGPSRA